jgi:drug/metabolite transporter (DMT)-like permease
MRPKASPAAVWAALILLYVVWGSTYLGIKVAIDTMPPFVMGAFRFIPAGVLLSLFVIVRSRGRIRRPRRREVVDAAIVGTLLLAGATSLVGWAEQTIPIGVAAVIVALVPMWLALLDRVFFRQPLGPVLALGIGIGIVGVAILAWPVGGAGDLDPAGLAAILASPVLWAIGTLYAARRAVLPGPALLASGIEMTAAGLALIVIAALTGEWAGFDIAAVSTRSWAGIAYLIVMGSIVGYSTFAWLITVAPMSRVSTYAYVNPVVAVLLGAVVLGEPLTTRTIVASAVIVVAVAIIVTARTRPSRPAVAAPSAGAAPGQAAPTTSPSRPAAAR